ncbi:MAG: hypothetical protein HY518_03700 [Candidatus Aenigmarchaeota archaeon]|nr:hypothetical protein [Candidatus Aenigmarchaeota archaeon]
MDEATYETTIGIVRENLEGERQAVVNGLQFSYKRFSLPGVRDCSPEMKWCFVDKEGVVYASSHPDEYPEEEMFWDIIAYGERLKFERLTEAGIPAPSYTIESEKQARDAMAILKEVYYLQMKAAKGMGILKEFVEWGPEEEWADELCARLAFDSLESGTAH